MRSETQKHFIGYVYLILSIIICVAAPFIVRELYINEDTLYKKPFFIAYFCTIMYILYIVPAIWVNHSKNSKSLDPSTQSVVPYFPLKNGNSATIRLFILSTIIGAIGFVHSYFYNLGVEYTSVVSNFIIHDISDVIVFILCLLYLNWSFSWLRVLAIFVSIIGVSIIGYCDSHDTKNISPLLGDFFSIISTFFYALYLTLTKKYLDEEDIDWNLYFYYSGITVAVSWLPFLLFLHYTGIEPFELPNTLGWILLLIEGFFGYVLADYTLSLATVNLDPLLVDLGLGAISPLALIFDHYYEDITYEWLYLIGYGFVALSFVIIVLYDFYYEIPSKEEDEKREKLLN